jgi:hypothetical protein
MRQSAIKIKDGILSFVISAIGVGALVWNAYMLNNVGYPNWFSNIGDWIVRGSLIFAILPAIPLVILAIFGLEIPLRGRESFIQLNMWLWIYCVIFYSVLIYFLLQYRRKRRSKRMLAVSKDGKKSGANA